MKNVEREIITCGKLLFERRLISGWGGNLSCRLDKEEFLITGQHAPLGFLSVKNLVRIDGSGKAINPTERPSSETPMHVAVYAGTDARAIVHVHPPQVVAFSLSHDSFIPISFEEKYTLGEVPVIPQDTPTVTRPEQVVDELKYRPVVIIKGHGTVAIGRDLQEAFLFTDLLEEAVHCHFLNQTRTEPGVCVDTPERALNGNALGRQADAYPLFSEEHMQALVASANRDAEFRVHGHESDLSTSLTLHMDESDTAWTVSFSRGEIIDLNRASNGKFMISGKEELWMAVFSNRIDPFFATQQGKLKLERGELAQLSRWYKPFHRAFSIWQTIPVK
ncbi:MAG TPA: class II aldolase/adducin family protein [Candidatus Binatia bacterium]